MQKILLSCLFLLLILQSCGVNNLIEDDQAQIPLPITNPTSVELLGEKDQLLVVNFNQILDLNTPLSLKIKQKPTKGKITFVEQSGLLIYEATQPASAGTDSFTYEVTYSNGQVLTGEITIQLYDEDSKLGLDSCKRKATYDYIETFTNTPFTTNILANDIFCDEMVDNSSAIINISTEHGALTLNSGQVTYTPETDFVGYDQFIYSVCTDKGTCASAVGEILVADPVICNFKLKGDQYEIELTNQVLDSAIWQWNVFSNDSLCIDEVDWSTFKITKDPLYGTAFTGLSAEEEKVVSFVPDYSFQGTDMFTYEICDTLGVCYSANVQVTITNNIVFTATLNDDLLFYKNQTDTNLDVLLNDLVDENTIDWTSFHIINQAENGTTQVKQNPTGKYIISYTPNPNFSGVEKLSYGLCLFSGECFEAEVKLLVQPNDFICPAIAPLAKNDTVVFNNEGTESKSLEIAVLDNDDFCFADVDWNSFEIVSPPQYGSTEVIIGESISYNFTANQGYTGINQDDFSYRWTQNGQTFEATVVIKFEGKPYTCDDISMTDSLSNIGGFERIIIVNANTEGDKLRTTIQYIGGCDFDLNTHDLVVTDQYSTNQGTVTYKMKYLFKDDGDCSFIVRERRCFDLSPLKINPSGGTVILKIEDYEDDIIYTY